MSQHEDEVMGPGTQSPEGPFIGMPPMPMDPADWMALLQNMAANQPQLQTLLMNQANAPQQPVSHTWLTPGTSSPNTPHHSNPPPTPHPLAPHPHSHSLS